MRIERLDLIRYGKFTDRSIDLPAAERDVHVIVGPNEAGKSTVRAAVLDLLYGIPKNTRHAFVHSMPDMRLGARLTQGGDLLEMQRVKGNKQTLRDLADKPLADNALAPFLGATDRDFFAQMFGLDHERLVKGGHSILSASNDLGQILFQSAAGIAGLGTVRDDLEAQAEGLWSRRRSSERQYYIASDALERATAALKQATVRTKDWAEVQARLSEIEGTHAQVRLRHAEVKQRRSLLERVRRVAPHLVSLDEAAVQITALGNVSDLPEEAGKTLAEAERAIGAAQAEIGHQSALMSPARAALASLVVDTRMRAAGTEVTELNEQRLQYRAYDADIARRQAEMDAQWAVVLRLAGQLGWDSATDDAVRARLPSDAVRASLSRLVRSYPALRQSVEASDRALKAKQAEVVQARAELARLPASEASLSLQAALAKAQRLGDFDARLGEHRLAVQRQESALEAALSALGQWRMPAEPLRAIAVPSADLIKSLTQEQVNEDAQSRALAGRIRSLDQQLQKARLDVRQYQSSHDTVSLDEVTQARLARDQTWQDVKASADQLAQRGSEFELQVATADALADRRHDTIQEASELQSRIAQVERAEQDLAHAQAELASLQAEGEGRARRWSVLAGACGLPGLPFDAASAWLEARAEALAADGALHEARAALKTIQAAIEDVRVSLASALGQDATQGDGAVLSVLMLEADGRVRTAASAGGQRKSLDKQMADGERDAAPLSDEALQARQALDEWSRQWVRLLGEAGLDPKMDVVLVEGLLGTFEEVAQALASMRKTKLERIDKMRADLDSHAAAAKALAERVAPELANQDAAAIALALVTRLAQANEAQLEAERLRAVVDGAERKLDEATLKRRQAQALVAPLVQRAGLDDIDGLANAIDLSDRRRALLAISAAAERTTREGGDGLSIEQLRAEATGMDMAALVGELSDITAQEDRLVNQLTELSSKRQAATTALHAIGGAADAAKAEAQRQEALAAMSDVVERYVKVFTAAKLLRWSIEQYREAKQGPMLSAASAIFARLTLGSFDRLTVDFESDPPKLLGRRPNGSMVDIEGLSEGTRDQLYLALRLAALDMHLSQAQVLPFIADDLFINYDDLRSKGGLEALGELSRKTQVLFLTHHDHLLPVVQEVFGSEVNVVRL